MLDCAVYKDKMWVCCPQKVIAQPGDYQYIQTATLESRVKHESEIV